MEKIKINKNNLFDLIRLYASFQVLIQHGSYYLNFKLPQLIGYLFNFAGVPIFFTISGFLVSLSWINSNYNFKKYFISRFLRIFPALWFSTLISYFMILQFGKSNFAISLKGIIWLISQSTFITFWNPDELRDVGIGVINGSLWTIPIEIQFYILVPIIFSLCQLLKKKTGIENLHITLITLSILSIASSLILPRSILDTEILEKSIFYIKLFYVTIIPYLSKFLMGSILIIPYKVLGQKKSSLIFFTLGTLMFIFGSFLNKEGLIFIYLEPLCAALIIIGIGLIKVPF